MKIGLVLSGGGILGVAHIGLLEEIDKNNIKISEIAGCSSGAIIGSLYAAGGVSRVDKFLQYLESLGTFSKTKINLPGNIFDNFKKALELFLEGSTFENLRIPFSLVATDVNNGESVHIKKGKLVSAILASAAYPGFFNIQHFDGRYLIDGGVLANFPLMALSDDVDFILGSYLGKIVKISQNDDKELKLNKFNTFSRSIDIAQDKMSKPWIEKCDYCFVPPTSNFRWNNFSNFREIRKTGQDHARKEINQIIKKLLKK